MEQLTARVQIRQSRFWQTNSGIVDGPEGALLIDPGVYPDELAEIADRVGDVAAGFCTHAHWDHMLWAARFGIDTPRFASTSTVALATAERDTIERSVNGEEVRIGLTPGTGWDRDLMFHMKPPGWGETEIAGIVAEIIPVPGHEYGQAALLLPDDEILFAADTLSDIELPSLRDGGASIPEYLQSLDRLQAAINRVVWIVPGHGAVADRTEAQHRLDADRRYLEALKPAIRAAGIGESVEDVARRIIHDLDERRANANESWDMHLTNVQQLLIERERAVSELPIRRSGRIILLDDIHRVWLLRIKDPVNPRWILPGGRVEAGEQPIEAARRELWEECGIRDVEIGALVGIQRGDAVVDGGWHHTEDHCFLAKLGEQQPSMVNMTEAERDYYYGAAWLAAQEIQTSVEPIYPIGLADLIEELATGSAPEEPWLWEG